MLGRLLAGVGASEIRVVHRRVAWEHTTLRSCSVEGRGRLANVEADLWQGHRQLAQPAATKSE